mgnify:CR=1 FL=1
MLSVSKESKIDKLEKKIKKIEERTDNKIHKLEQNFKAYREALEKLEDEKTDILKRHNKLKEKYNNLQKKFEQSKLAKDVQNKLVAPTKKEIEENARLIQYAIEPNGEEKFKKELEEKKKKYEKKKRKAKKAIKKLEKGKNPTKKEDGKQEEILRAMHELGSLVHRKGKLRVNEASEEFEVSEELIMSIAKSLEDKGKIKIKNPIIGKPLLEKV